jgi:hypothetical protein
LLKPNARHSRSRRPWAFLSSCASPSNPRPALSAPRHARLRSASHLPPATSPSTHSTWLLVLYKHRSPVPPQALQPRLRPSHAPPCTLQAHGPDPRRNSSPAIGTWPIELAQTAHVQQTSATLWSTRRRNAVITTTQATVAHAASTRETAVCLAICSAESVQLRRAIPALLNTATAITASLWFVLNLPASL